MIILVAKKNFLLRFSDKLHLIKLEDFKLCFINNYEKNLVRCLQQRLLFAVHFYSSGSHISHPLYLAGCLFILHGKLDSAAPQNEETGQYLSYLLWLSRESERHDNVTDAVERCVFFHAPPSSTWVVKVTCEI